MGWAIIIQTLPWFLMTPLAGYVADRFPRRRLMILADIARGFVVLGLLLVRRAADVWLVYALLGLEVIFASIFEPARNALLPDIASTEEILPANALSSATWSFALTSGAALGGLVTSLLGRPVSFVVNSASFFASALLVGGIRVSESHLKPTAGSRETGRASRGLSSLREGREYLKRNPKVMVLILGKTGLGIFGGVFLLLAVFGERIFPIAGHGALAMGLLYAARGAGAGIGPFLGHRLTGGLQDRMRKSIGAGFFVISISYMAFSRAPNLPLAALAIFCAHMGGSNIWVMTTTLLQLNTAERFRGRVFALDFGLLMLMVSGSNYLTGLGLDKWNLSARQLAAGLGLAMVLPGLLWLLAQARWSKAS